MCNLFIYYFKGDSFFHLKIVQKGMQVCDVGHISNINGQWSCNNEKVMA